MRSLLRITILPLLIAATPLAAAEAPRPTVAKGLPPNSIDCADWTRNSDGSWSAHHNAKPFDIDRAKQMSLQDSRIGPHTVNAGGYDLTTVLDQKCATM